MRVLLEKIGKVIFFLAWPAFYVYLRARERTRILVEYNGQVLATKNWISDGDWSLPGGGMHKGEPVVRAALRELQEETGIVAESQNLRHVGHFTYKKYGLKFNYHVFALHLTAEPRLRIQAYEISRAQWFTPSKLRNQTDIAPDTAQALDAWLKL